MTEKRRAPIEVAESRLDPGAEMRFWFCVDSSGGEGACWPWRSYKLPKGYGQFNHSGRHWYAHRMAYEIIFGIIPDGSWVLHRCDNPPCCNPAHLFLGDNASNVIDKRDKMRGGTRLTRETVAALRLEYSTGAITQVALARKQRLRRV